MAEACYPFAADDHALAVQAVDWLHINHGDVIATLDRGEVALRSEVHDMVALRALWQASLANQRLFARAISQRAAVIESLAR